MALFLTFNTTPQGVEVGLFNDTHLLESRIVEKTAVNKTLLITCHALLHAYSYTLSDINSIIAMTGPAPFTTLRVCLVTINGLHLATGIPLIGVDGLKTYYHSIDTNQQNSTPIAVLNAFNNDIYYAFKTNNGDIITGYMQYAEFPSFVQQRLSLSDQQKCTLYGTGVTDELVALLTKELQTTIVLGDGPLFCSLEQVHTVGYNHYQTNTVKAGDYIQLVPQYLKIFPYSV